jgi:glycosyltransferase involved in cell wall biosynthesis
MRVGFVGRLEPYKGGTIAIRAFLAAAPTGDAELAVIGDGTEAESMRAAVGEAAASDRVVFTGALSQAETLKRIGDLDVMLVPSLTTPTWKEQFGRVAVQAMAAGVAVIASDSGSLREVVGDAGMLVGDPDHRVRLGELGRRRATEKFSWEAVAAGADEMYRAMTQSDTQPQPR